MERYRSGHNGADSKCCRMSALRGASNPHEHWVFKFSVFGRKEISFLISFLLPRSCRKLVESTTRKELPTSSAKLHEGRRSGQYSKYCRHRRTAIILNPHGCWIKGTLKNLFFTISFLSSFLFRIKSRSKKNRKVEINVTGKVVREVEGATLEMSCAARHPGFESLTFRHFSADGCLNPLT